MMTYLTNPLFGVALSLVLFIIWQGLLKISKGFFLFQPLFFAMITGILVLVVMAHGLNISPKAFYTKAYKQGGFHFLVFNSGHDCVCSAAVSTQ